MLPDDPGDHPFTPRLEADELLLWAGRPDESVFMQQQRAGLQARAKPGSPFCKLLAASPYASSRTAPSCATSARPPCASPLGTNAYISLVFGNGDTKLLSDTARPDGTRHLVYATVFFTPRRDARR